MVVGGWKGFGSTEAVMQLTVGTLMFTVASLFLTKCLCSHLTHVLNSKISPGVQQAVGADLVRQVQRECINFFHRGEKCFLRFQYAPLCLYPCISVFLRSHLTPEEIFERFSLVLKDRCKKKLKKHGSFQQSNNMCSALLNNESHTFPTLTRYYCEL